MRITGMLFITLFMVSCSQSNNTKAPNDSQEKPQSERQIQVTDEFGSAIEGATIVIGDEPGQPFADNMLQTDGVGKVEVSNQWVAPASITVIKPGYTSVTFLNVQPEFLENPLEVTLKKLAVVPRLELNGQVTGFDNLKKDGFLDFALVIPSLTVASSLYFDMSGIVSSEVDPITVMGTTLNIPTNVYLPKQTENYTFFSVTIEKAFYKLFFLTSGNYLFSATRGKVDFKKLAGLMQSGKSFFDAVNEFQFTSMQTHVVNIQEPKQSLNISPNALALIPKIPFTIQNPDNNKMLFGVSLFSEGGKLLPADVKLRDSAQAQQLSLPSTATDVRVLLALTQKETIDGKEVLSKSLATTLVTPNGLGQAVFLDEIQKPTGDSSGVTMKLPTIKTNIKPFATYASLSDVELIPTSGYNLEKKSVLWEVYSTGWIDQAQIPSLVPSFMAQVKRWDVVYYGVPTSEKKFFTGPKSLDNATHAVQNAFDF